MKLRNEANCLRSRLGQCVQELSVRRVAHDFAPSMRERRTGHASLAATLAPAVARAHIAWSSAYALNAIKRVQLSAVTPERQLTGEAEWSHLQTN